MQKPRAAPLLKQSTFAQTARGLHTGNDPRYPTMLRHARAFDQLNSLRQWIPLAYSSHAVLTILLLTTDKPLLLSLTGPFL